MPFFFDLSSLAPLVERNPFEPLLVRDSPTIDSPGEAPPAVEAPPDFGLPIPEQYDFDMMRALVQDPFRLYVYWHLRGNPRERLGRLFPAPEAERFSFSLRLIDETNNITVFFEAPYTREYWFNVFPDRTYRVELGLRSPEHGYIKLLSSQAVTTPRGGPSDRVAPETEYQIGADDYLQVLRESHLIPERAYNFGGFPERDGADSQEAISTGAGTAESLESLPQTFQKIMRAIADIQAGREYERWWERLGQEELADLVREFLAVIRGMGEGELGYILLMRYLPELLRRAIRAEGGEEVRVDKPVALFLAERLGQSSSEMGPGSSSEGRPNPGGHAGKPDRNGSISPGLPGGWLPGLSGNLSDN